MKKVLLEDMTWKEAEEAFKKTDVVIIPWGSTETHGPHNPLGTDTFTAKEISKRVGEKADVIVAPAIPVGWCPYHLDFPGSLTFSRPTLETILEELCEGLMRFGVKRFLFISGHGGNLDFLETVALRLRRNHGVIAVVPRWFRPEIDESVPELKALFPFHDHGGQKETSLNLAIRPEAVRMDLYQAPAPPRKLSENVTVAGLYGWDFENGTIGVRCYTMDGSDQGYFEPPNYPASDADGAKGEKYLEIVTDYLARFVKEFKTMELLPQDW